MLSQDARRPKGFPTSVTHVFQLVWWVVPDFSGVLASLVLLQVPVFVGLVVAVGTGDLLLGAVSGLVRQEGPLVIGGPTAVLARVQLVFLPVLVGRMKGQQGLCHKLFSAHFAHHRVLLKAVFFSEHPFMKHKIRKLS